MMTSDDAARIRGELFAFKILITPCLSLLAAQHEDPTDFLDKLERAGIDAIRKSAPSYATGRGIETVVEAATGWMDAVVEGSKTLVKTSPPPRLQ
jgi:hypothetical protein